MDDDDEEEAPLPCCCCCCALFFARIICCSSTTRALDAGSPVWRDTRSAGADATAGPSPSEEGAVRSCLHSQHTDAVDNRHSPSARTSRRECATLRVDKAEVEKECRRGGWGGVSELVKHIPSNHGLIRGLRRCPKNMVFIKSRGSREATGEAGARWRRVRQERIGGSTDRSDSSVK